MHLIELIAELETVKVARGNVKLVDVIVMASGDQKPIADFADRASARAKAPELAIDVTGMSDDQVEEILAENPDAKLIRRAPEPNTAPGELCHTPGCVAGEVGHEGECKVPEDLPPAGSAVLTMPVSLDAQVITSGTIMATGAEVVDRKPDAVDLAKVMETAAHKLPITFAGEIEMDGKPLGHGSGMLGPRCEQWDGKGQRCFRVAGHQDDHDFNVAADAIVEKPTASEPGDAGLPDTLQE